MSAQITGNSMGGKMGGSGAKPPALPSKASIGVRPPAQNRAVPPPLPRPRGETRPSASNGTSQQNPETITRMKRTRGQDEDISEPTDMEQGGESSIPVKYRIGSLVSIMLFFLGITLDGVELLLDLLGTFLAGFGVVIGYIKDAFVVVVLPGIFLLLGAPFWKGRKAKKKMVAMVTSFLVSIVPWLGAVMPETTISIMVTIYLTRKEDKEKAGVEGQGKIASAAITRMKRMRK